MTDLLALPGGEVLVLERVVGLGLSAKIYLIDMEGATDTTRIGSLARGEVIPVKKKLVFERNTGGKNFEGITLGPELENGWRSLILIEDNGGGEQHALMPLRLKAGPPESTR